MSAPLNRPTIVNFAGMKVRSTRLVGVLFSTLGVVVFYAILPIHFLLQASLVVGGIWWLVYYAETGHSPMFFLPKYYLVRWVADDEEAKS